ncbi:hypothetical protein DFS34DRAFT_599001 [Phlyctochytrium arcticum]|nr:hypothetical protein DFS34DRAFT_599001 [Phlyctochytrium arcticum]
MLADPLPMMIAATSMDGRRDERGPGGRLTEAILRRPRSLKGSMKRFFNASLKLPLVRRATSIGHSRKSPLGLAGKNLDDAEEAARRRPRTPDTAQHLKQEPMATVIEIEEVSKPHCPVQPSPLHLSHKASEESVNSHSSMVSSSSAASSPSNHNSDIIPDNKGNDDNDPQSPFSIQELEELVSHAQAEAQALIASTVMPSPPAVIGSSSSSNGEDEQDPEMDADSSDVLGVMNSECQMDPDEWRDSQPISSSVSRRRRRKSWQSIYTTATGLSSPGWEDDKELDIDPEIIHVPTNSTNKKRRTQRMSTRNPMYNPKNRQSILSVYPIPPAKPAKSKYRTRAAHRRKSLAPTLNNNTLNRKSRRSIYGSSPPTYVDELKDGDRVLSATSDTWRAWRQSTWTIHTIKRFSTLAAPSRPIMLNSDGKSVYRQSRAPSSMYKRHTRRLQTQTLSLEGWDYEQLLAIYGDTKSNKHASVVVVEEEYDDESAEPDLLPTSTEDGDHVNDPQAGVVKLDSLLETIHSAFPPADALTPNNNITADDDEKMWENESQLILDSSRRSSLCTIIPSEDQKRAFLISSSLGHSIPDHDYIRGQNTSLLHVLGHDKTSSTGWISQTDSSSSPTLNNDDDGQRDLRNSTQSIYTQILYPTLSTTSRSISPLPPRLSLSSLGPSSLSLLHPHPHLSDNNIQRKESQRSTSPTLFEVVAAPQPPFTKKSAHRKSKLITVAVPNLDSPSSPTKPKRYSVMRFLKRVKRTVMMR